MDPTVRPNSEQIPYEVGGLSVILQVLSRRQQGVLLVPRGSADQDDKDPSVKPGHQLLLNSAVLMPSAKAGEVIVVQVESEVYYNSKV